MSADIQGSIDSATEYKTPGDKKALWEIELKAGLKAQERWHKRANRVVNRYTAGDRADTENFTFQLNLFYSNIQTTQAMMFGRLPEISIDRRNTDFGDDAARVASSILQRMLQADIGKPNDQYSTSLKLNLQDRLITGLGVARVRYEMDKETRDTAEQLDMNGQVVAEGFSEEVITSERAPLDYVHWRDCAWSPCRTWSELRWFGFKEMMTRDQLVERFGKEMGEAIPLTKTTRIVEDESLQEEAADSFKRGEVWEIWDKDKKQVVWYCADYEKLLDVKPDPFGLTGFFPVPRPMASNLTTSAYMPIPDFTMAQDLYNEIDNLETRIAMLTQAVKAVGVYNSAIDGVKRMLVEGVENDLIPVDNWAVFSENGGMQGVIDWLPIETIAGVLNQLIARRNDCKSQLFEISGMSDIMRGAAASAGGPVSATERALEARFASVRIAALQDEFSTYATDLIRLRAEIISKHFSPEQIVKQSNILNTPDGKDQQLIQQAVELIKNSQELVWRVQVRPESVAMVDFAALKQERTEYLMAVSQFLQSSGPLIEKEPASAPMLMEMLKWGLAGFKGSQDIEGVIDRAMEQMAQKLAQPQEQQPDPEAQKMQMQMQLEQTKSQAAMQLEQAKNQGAMQLEQQGLQIDMQRIQAELQAKIQEKQADIQQDITKEKAQLEANTTEEQFETEQFMIRETHKADEAIRVELAKTQLAKSKDID
tara:strand:- start:125 stop:2251 length:2127 start_codon:yes stop_codon:yes gene_type:complete